MKYQTKLAAAAALASVAYGFPTNMPVEAVKRASSGSISGTNVPDPAQVLGIFNAEAQYVSNKGKYAFVKPGPNDIRGPCPGLNAMANHGYIPHNGVGTIEEFIQGTYQVFGMGLDLGAFLAVYGALLEGDGTQWSIAGPVKGYFGNGLVGSHDNYEADVSPTRPDLYQYGNNYKIVLSQWEQLYAYQAHKTNAESNYNLAVLQDFRSKRFDQQIANNPDFFNAPFSGVLVQPAAYTFIYRFMGNKSAEHPDGQLTQEVLKSFFGMTQAKDGSWSGGLGHERIPDNWYKRAIGDEYTIPFFNLDVVQEGIAYPKFFDVGGNLGKKNSFAGVDITNLTGGIYNSGDLLKGNAAFCLGYQTALGEEPDLFKSLLLSAGGAAATAIADLGCPSLLKINTAQLEKFPGYTKAQKK